MHDWQHSIGCISIYDQPLANWMNEGIANWLAYRVSISAGAMSAQEVRDFMVHSAKVTGQLDKPLEDLEPTTSRPWSGHVGYVAIDELIEAVGGDVSSLRRICEAVDQGSSLDQAFEAAFGMPKAAFYEDFEAWRRSQTGWLQFTSEPADVAPPNNVFPAGQRLYPSVEVSVPASHTASVSLTLGTDPCGGTLEGGGPVSPVDGVAVFENVIIDTVCDGYTLAASSSGLEPVDSEPFDVTIPGDLNLDGEVDQTDLDQMTEVDWGKTTYPPADINKDGTVDTVDLGILLSHWTAPGVTTKPATGIAPSSATLNGTVSSHMDAEAWFVWGTDPDLLGSTSATPRQPIGAGATDLAFAAPASDLTSATTYYYRAVAESAGGTAEGGILNFTAGCTGLDGAALYAQSFVVTLPSTLYRVSVSACGSDEEIGLIRTADGAGVRIEELASAAPGMLWAYSTGWLYRVDTGSAEAEAIGPTGSGGMIGLATHPDGSLFGTSGYSGAPGDDALVWLDTETGVIAGSVSLGSWGIVGDIAYAADGELFAIASPDYSVQRFLVTIDPDTGAVMHVNANAPISPHVAGLVFVGSTLYGVTLNETLVTIDTSTATVALVRSLSFPGGGAAGSD